jgi:hypothetical protein
MSRLRFNPSTGVGTAHQCRNGFCAQNTAQRWKGGDGGDINNSTVIGYNTIIVELTGIVIFGSFVMVGRVERSLHMLWW